MKIHKCFLSDVCKGEVRDIRIISVKLRVKEKHFYSWRNIPYWVRISPLWRLHDHTPLDTPQSVGVLWTSDQPDAETSS